MRSRQSRENKKHYSKPSNSFHDSSLSKANLLLFTLIFAAIGAYLIYHSFAATTTTTTTTQTTNLQVGDLNNDGKVDILDLSLLLSNYGKASLVADTNNDGTVDVIDLSILLSHYGQIVSNPQPSPSAGACAAPPTTAFFTSSWEDGTFDEWWHSYLNAGSNENYPVQAVVNPTNEGIPSCHGSKVAKFIKTTSDISAGKIHAKVFQNIPMANAKSDYKASYYIPSNYSVPSNAWVNVLQFKREWTDSNGWHQDPQWWINIAPAWCGGKSGLVLFANYNNNRWGYCPQTVSFPRDKWFELEVKVYPGDRMEFYIDGQLFDTGRTSTYQVGPSTGDTYWIFGVGNYSESANYLYIDDASVTKL